MSPRPVHVAALLAGITFAVFSPTLSAQFVYDARIQILNDPFLLDPWNWLNVLSFRVLGMDVLDFNRPVNLASTMLDVTIWGREPFGHHLTSILLHVVNVLLVWRVSEGLIRRVGEGPRIPPVLGAAIFAMHPVVTEAVCEPTFREDLLVALFTLAAILLAMRHAPVEGIDPRRSAGIAACCLLAAGSKESGIVVPFLLAGCRMILRHGDPPGFWRCAIGGGAACTAAFLAARFLLEVPSSVIFEARPQYPGGSLAAALMIQPRILALYVQQILFPAWLCADYGFYSVRHLSLALSLGILAIVAAVALLAAYRDRRMLFALLVILLPLVPVANLVPIYRAAADRYLYLSLAGVAMTVVLLLDAPWLDRYERVRGRLALVTVSLMPVLGCACIARQAVWTNQLALWRDTYAKNPAAFTAAAGLGEALREVGDFAGAERAIREAIRLSGGGRGDPLATLALILDAQGRSTEADEALAKALESDPRLADPDGRVAVMAMERPYAEDLKKLLAKRALPGMGRGSGAVR